MFINRSSQSGTRYPKKHLSGTEMLNFFTQETLKLSMSKNYFCVIIDNRVLKGYFMLGNHLNLLQLNLL